MKDLNALHVFIALYQTGSTQRAATRLGRSQSYVSKVLAQLREELGDPLFVRTSINMSPTSYANEIAPKLQQALTLVSQSLEPEAFDPMQLDKVAIHMIEPYIVAVGKKVIDCIRKESNAEIVLKCWSQYSEGLIEDGSVDIGFHLLKDRSQIFQQDPLVGITGKLVGKKNAELVKYVSPGINEHIDYFKQIDKNAHATIFVDHCVLLEQLMQDYQTFRHLPVPKGCKSSIAQLSMALIYKTSQKQAAKIKWIKGLLTPILEDLDISLLNID